MDAVVTPDLEAESLKRKLEERPEKPAPDRVECEYCGQSFTARGIARHRKTCSAKPADEPEAAVDPAIFDQIAGAAVTSLLVSLATVAKRRVSGDPEAELEIPAGWEEQAAEIHSALLKKYLGGRLAEYSLEVAALLVWLPVLHENFITVESAGDRSTGER